MSRLAIVAALLTLVAGTVAAQPQAWEPRFYNRTPAPGDFLLPMPCGGQMAFRQIEIPSTGWLDDRRVVLGGGEAEFDYAESARGDFIAGSFTDPAKRERRYYYLGKYEVTQNQYAAVTGDCPTVNVAGTIAASRLNWFDAVAFAHKYTEWLYKNARDKLPTEDGTPGYLRLPTEAEWEFAARGGIEVSEADFRGKVFPVPPGELSKFVWFQGSRSATGKVQAVGLLRPNPLGLYDILGNAAEIVVEPYRLNRVGRMHGQAGGFTARGGDFLTPEENIRSSARTEFPYFDANANAPTRPTTVGMRVTIVSSVLASAKRVTEIREEWRKLQQALITQTQAGGADDPLRQLEDVQKRTEDLDLKSRLEKVAVGVKAEIAARNEQRNRTVRVLIQNGAIVARKIFDDDARMKGAAKFLKETEQDAATDASLKAELPRIREAVAQADANLKLAKDIYGRTVIQLADDVTAALINEQFPVARRELETKGVRGLVAQAEIYVKHVLAYQSTKKIDVEAWANEIVK